MLQINKILFPTDYSPGAEQALGHAGYLAAWHEAELHVFHAVERSESEEASGRPRMSEEDLADKIRAALHRSPQAEEAPGDDMPEIVQAQVRNASAPDAILEYADEQNIDLVVMGTHGRRGVRHLLMGSVAEEVVRRASCPVMTVHSEKERPQRLVERILVPIDFSEYSHLAIAYAVELAQTYGARIDLLHVVNEMAFTGVYGLEPVAIPPTEIVERAEERLAEMTREEIGFEHVLAEVRLGHPPASIVDAAEEHDTDLIVIPTHGRTGLEHFLMGSVAEKVVRSAPSPVFTVKSFGKSLLPPSAEDDSAGAVRSSEEEQASS